MVVELNDVDERIVSLLVVAGLNKNLARTVVYLSKAKKSVSRDIERGANMRQPEVSLAMKELKERGWVKERELKKKGKGRPLKEYMLTKDLKEIVKMLVENKRKELEKMEKDLEELEKLVGLR